MKTDIKRYYTITKEYKKICGVKKPYNAKFRECLCNCGKVFKIRSERWKAVIACKACTYTIKTREKKGGLYLTIPNFSVLRRKYMGYKKRAKFKKQAFEITVEQAVELFISNCYFCGAEPQEVDAIYNGNTLDGVAKANTIDRLDSSLGYTTTNVVSACLTCNNAKLDMPEKDFRLWIIQAYKHLNK